jgi:hypothetical protein
VVYQVDGDADRLLDRYDWYAPNGIVLGWSPLAGKVAVMSAMAGPAEDWRQQEEIRFSMGGEKLKSYTSGDLIALGAEDRIDEGGRHRAWFRLVSCEQIPGTNEYDFIVEFPKIKRLRFNITTGELRHPARP